jgi:hypothetical protein
MVRRLGCHIVVAAVLGTIPAIVAPVTASAQVGLTVTPTRVPIGGTVTLSGTAPPPSVGIPLHPVCPASSHVELTSGAFLGHGPSSDGSGTLTVPKGADGSFRIQATILPGVRPGIYTITAVCVPTANAIIPFASATLVVTSPGLPATGVQPTQDPSPGNAAMTGAVVVGAVAILLLAAVTARRARAVRRKVGARR